MLRAPGNQTGVALAMVAWFLAAMSLLVMGIVSSAQTDVRMAQLHVAKAKAVAAGDGAIQLMLAASWQEKPQAGQPATLQTLVILVGGTNVQVELVPVAGLVSLNAAPPEVLEQLFASAGAQDAKSLAGGVVKWRSKSAYGMAASGRATRFNAIEDILVIEGVGRTLFDATRDMITTQGSREIDTNAAPEAVKAALGGMEAASSVAEPEPNTGKGRKRARKAARQKMLLEGGNAFRVDAYVTVGDQTWLRRRWVKMEATAPGGLPWKFHRTEAVRVVSAL